MANRFVTMSDDELIAASEVVTNAICEKVRNPDYKKIFEQVIEIFMTEFNAYLFDKKGVKNNG